MKTITIDFKEYEEEHLKSVKAGYKNACIDILKLVKCQKLGFTNDQMINEIYSQFDDHDLCLKFCYAFGITDKELDAYFNKGIT